jgi:hypothetical protein
MMRSLPALCILLTALISTTIRADDSAIHSITVGQVFPVEVSQGDTWDLAWARNGSVYSPTNDGPGFEKGYWKPANVLFNRIIGDNPEKLDGELMNIMSDYGIASQKGPDGCTWKSSGCIALDGVLYLLVARHLYGGDGGPGGDFDKRQVAHGASFIKSTDNGKTWTRSEQENYDHPMFPGNRFAAPYFVQYGQDGHETNADGSDKYVYALSNNGFWDNGDYVVLGRVLRTKMSDLNGADWQFYTEGNGTAEAAWTSNIHDAKPVLCKPDHLGMTRAVYLPVQKCYLMIGWYYPTGGGKIPGSEKKTIWDFYVASHPWGPWRVVDSHTWTPQGYYCPGICPKFSSPDGSTVWAFAAGNWWDGSVYKLNAISLSIK